MIVVTKFFRASLRNGDSIRYLTTCNVADYLVQNDLYNEESEKKERILYSFDRQYSSYRFKPSPVLG